MFQLIYTSIAAAELEPGAVFRIIEQSARNNAASGLCGFLVFSNQRFFQVIEGGDADIDALLKRLEADPRHHTMTITSRSPISAPHFVTWRMKRLIAPACVHNVEQVDPELARAPKNVQAALADFLGIAAPANAA